MKKNNIILLGMMGAGKSFIGKALIEYCPTYTLIDTDILIEHNSKMKISEIFENFSEKYFRDLETKTITELCKNNNQIISLGGGTFERDVNRKILKDCGFTIYLKASAEVLFDRIKNETHRPLLKQGFGVDKIKEILNKRICNYEQADIIIDTENKTSYNIIKEILGKIKSYAE